MVALFLNQVVMNKESPKTYGIVFESLNLRRIHMGENENLYWTTIHSFEGTKAAIRVPETKAPKPHSDSPKQGPPIKKK